MTAQGADRIQDLLSRNGALRIALEKCISEFASVSGKDARHKIETLRDELIARFKNASVTAEREMDLAKIVGPAIEVLQIIFDDALSKLPRD